MSKLQLETIVTSIIHGCNQHPTSLSYSMSITAAMPPIFGLSFSVAATVTVPATPRAIDGSANTFKLYPAIILHFKAC